MTRKTHLVEANTDTIQEQFETWANAPEQHEIRLISVIERLGLDILGTQYVDWIVVYETNLDAIY